MKPTRPLPQLAVIVAASLATATGCRMPWSEAPVESITTVTPKLEPKPIVPYSPPAVLSAPVQLRPSATLPPQDGQHFKARLVARKLASTLELGTSAQILDLSRSATLFARAFDGLGDRQGAHQTDFAAPDLAAKKWDLIFFADTFHQIQALENPVEHLVELKDALSPTGSLALLEFKDGKLPIGPNPSQKTPSSTRHQTLTDAGLTLVASFATHVWFDLEIWNRERITR